MTSELNPSDAWSKGRERLAADEALGDLYDICRQAYEQIERIRLTALGWDRSSSRRQTVHKLQKLPELIQAQLAVGLAQTAVQKLLSELDQKQHDH